MSLLQLWTSTGYLANYVTQTSIAYLPKDKLEVVPLPVPPLPEQRAIAKALSDVDELIGALNKLVAKKRAIKQAAMQQLLTGKTRLPGFSGEWEMRRLGDLLSYERPDHYIVQRTDYMERGDVPVLTANKSFSWVTPTRISVSAMIFPPSYLMTSPQTVNTQRFLSR